ncbi:MAG: ABC transporter ATP-binding protein, partial [Candidatus Methylomirabilota bacterium]
MELYLRLVRRAYPHRWRILQSLACMMLVSVLNAVSIGSLQPVFDGLFGGAKGGISLPPAIANLLGDLPARIAAYVEGRQMEVLTIVALFVLVVYILKALLTFIDVYQMRWVSSRLQTDLSNDVYGHIHNLSLSYFTRTPTGEIMQRTVVDVSMVGGSVTDLFRNALREPFNILSLVGLLFVINWKLALLSFTIFPIAIYPIIFFGRKIRKRSGKVLEVMTELLTLTQESIAGARIVKAFGMEKYEQERYRTQNERVFRAVMRISLMDCLTHPFMETLGGIGVVAGIWVGGYFVLSGEITGGGFVAFLGALGSLYNPIKRISQINNNIQQGIAALKRIYQLLETKPEVVEAPDAVVLPQIAKRLEFSQVSFAYESNQPILRKVTFAARPGELVAIVGHSGAGKTTLVNLIPRFYDVTGGSIAIDGHDLRTVT